MGKLRLGKLLDRLCFSCSSSACFCMNGVEEEEDRMERKALTGSDRGQMVKIRDIMDGNMTLAYQLKPKMVVLRVSMHCNGCARKVEKHVKRMEGDLSVFGVSYLILGILGMVFLLHGVTSFEVDLQNKKVVVIGDIIPFEVLESVSKIKNAELWTSPC